MTRWLLAASRLLLVHGADAGLADKQGQRPIDVARKLGAMDLQSLLARP